MDAHLDRGHRAAERRGDLLVRQAVPRRHQQRRALAFRQMLQRRARRLEILPAGRHEVGPGREVGRVEVLFGKRRRAALRARSVQEEVSRDREQVRFDAARLDARRPGQRAGERLGRDVFGELTPAAQEEREAEDVLRVSRVELCEVHIGAL